MADVPKFLAPIYPVHLSRRLQDGRFLLVPSPELNSLLAGIVGHFARDNDIMLLAYACASNHWHVLGMAPSQEKASSFARGVNWSITMLLKERFGLDNSVSLWEGRLGQVQVLDDADLEDTFRYIVSHGCKEHLVEHPHDWPGLTSAHQIQTGVADRGVWVNRTEYGKALNAGKDVTEEDFTEYHELVCLPLPCLSEDGEAALDWSMRAGPELLEEIARKYADERARDGLGPVKGVKGAYGVMAEDPFKIMPKKLEPLPVCITADPEREREYRAARRAHIDSYYGAKGVLMRQKDKRPLSELMALFPPGSCIGHAGWRSMAV